MEKKQITLLTAQQLDKEIPLIAVASKKLDARIQLAAMSAISHREKHKDACYMNRLYLALGKGARHAALTEFFLRFGGVKANEDAATKKERPFVNDPTRKVDLAGAEATPWYECKKSPEPDEVFDIGAAFAKLIGRLNKAAETGKPIKGMTAQQIERLRQVTGGNVAEDVQESGLGQPEAA